MPGGVRAAIAVALVWMGVAGAARGEEPPGVAVAPAAREPPGVAVTPAASEPAGGPPAATTAAASLLAAADAAVDAGNLDLARSLYDRLAREFPDAPEGRDARRALRIMAVRAASPGPARPSATGQASGPSSDDVVVRQEPFSLKTKERLRLTTWEKLDFGITAFLYGTSVGFSFALSLNNPSDGSAFPPIALGALSYTLGAVAFLNLADPDRGDLPLALAITSYLPTTTLLVADAASDNPDSKRVALATAGVGILSVPLAVLAAHELDLDPGDTQLVRDAGFWGLVLGTTGMLGFGGSTQPFPFGGSFYQAPSTRAISVAGLAGLYGGLGLGLLGAHFGEVSLERVRVSTWGGYGGAVIGLLVAGAGGSSTENIYRGISIGALAGLIVTFVATSSLDGIPPDDPPAPHALRLTPTLAPMAGLDGQLRTTLGLGGRF